MRHRSLFWTVGGLAGLMVIGVTLGVTSADRTREPLQRINLAEPTAVSVVIEARGANHLAGNRAGSLVEQSRPLAIGDFNGDGIKDIAVGAPDERERTGVVFILFGKHPGPGPVPSTPDVRVMGDVAGDEFGFSLAAADVNHDGIADLLIGAPGASSSSQQKCGAVLTMLGSGSLSAGSIDFATLRGHSLALYGKSTGDRFGSSIAAETAKGRKPRPGDDTVSILVGAPMATGGGSIYFFSGISESVDLSAGDSSTVTVVGDADSALGSTVAFADLNADGTTDLVAGAPLQSGAAGAQIGAVYGFFRGGDMAASYRISEGEHSFALYGRSSGDHFGAALAVGDVTGDDQADLLIGAPDANYLGREDAGAVYVLSAGVMRTAMYGASAGDHLGASVAAGRSNSDTVLDVIAGAPGAASRRGTVSIVYGGETLAAGDLDLQQNADQVRITGKDDSGSFGWVVGSSVTMGRCHVIAGAPFAESDSGELYLIPQANAAPVTKVTTPNGGETVQIGNTFNITWTATDADGNNTISRVDVKLSTDGGATFPFVLAQSLPGNATNFQWQVNLPFTSVSAKVRVIATDDQDATGQDDSDSVFNIVDNGVPVTLTTPNGGEHVSFGQTAVISWSVSALNQSRLAGFDLFYSTDSGANFTSLIASGVSPGSLQFFWQVPPICAGKVRVLVIATTLTGARTSDSSNADFSIFNPGPTVDTGRMLLNAELGRMQFNTTPTADGFEILFEEGCLVELTKDEGGTEFVTFDKAPAVKKGGRKLVTKGKIDGKDINTFFPLGAIRTLRVTNPACGITQMTVRRFGDQFFAQQ